MPSELPKKDSGSRLLGYIGIDTSIYYIYQGNENRRKNYETFYPPRNKKGFTLAELLIVVAIIAVLIAIAIPVFSVQLDKSKQAVDDANLRSAESLAVADYLMNEATGELTYYFAMDEDSKTLGIKDIQNSGGTTIISGDENKERAPLSNSDYIKGRSSTNEPNTIVIKVKDGGVQDGSKWGTRPKNES